MHDAFSKIFDWLDGDFEGHMEDLFPSVLRSILTNPTSLPISEVVSKIGDIANLTEGRARMPLLDWPWLDGHSSVRDNYSLYSNISDVLDRTRDSHLYVCGNGSYLHSGSETTKRHFLAKNEDWHEAAPPGSFEKWYAGGTGGGLTLTRVAQKGDPKYDSDCEKEIRSKIYFSGNEPKSKGYWNVRPEIAVVCAFAADRQSMYRMATSSIISMAFVQAVRVSRGTSEVRCDDEVLQICTTLSECTVGGQIGILAAIYSRFLSPRGDEEFLRGKLGVRSGLPNIDYMKLSNNFYWLTILSRKVPTEVGVDTVANTVTDRGGVIISMPCVSGRRRSYEISAFQNALVFRDTSRTLLWISVSLFVVILIAVSVVFQAIGWAEALEKFLNLMFTVLIATAIGFAGIHTEENLLGNVMRFRRRIADLSDFPDQLFLDVVDYIEIEQQKMHNGNNSDLGRFISNQDSSWVSEYNRGETNLGRPVLLSELRNSSLSISSRFELCLCTNGNRRNLIINTNGTCSVSGPTAATKKSKIFLNSPVRLG